MLIPQVNTYSLSTVLSRIKQIISTQTQNKFFWVRAQISKIKSDQRGNYYLELIESYQGTIIAKSKATIWASQYVLIDTKLKKDTSTILKDGAEILCYAGIEYSEIHGLRLQIFDIDLNYSLGEIEKRKQESLLILQKGGFLEKNKQTILPTVIQKIAIIGSPTTAGFLDFTQQLITNEFKFNFKTTTHPCSVQGDRALTEIINHLDHIDTSLYDVIVIIRGGGSKFDLEIFNDLILAKKIATMPIPVLTGIGHETDLNIADLVAYHYLKTPTALASYIIDRAYSYYVKIQKTQQLILECYHLKIKESNHKTTFLIEQIKNQTQKITQKQQISLHALSNQVTLISQNLLTRQKVELNKKSDTILFLSKNNIKNKFHSVTDKTTHIEAYSKQYLQQKNSEINTTNNLFEHLTIVKINREKQRVEKLTQIIEVYNPQKNLNMGYSLVRKNGQIITNNSILQDGDVLDLEMALKKITFTITNISEQKKWKDIPTKAQL